MGKTFPVDFFTGDNSKTCLEEYSLPDMSWDYPHSLKNQLEGSFSSSASPLLQHASTWKSGHVRSTLLQLLWYLCGHVLKECGWRAYYLTFDSHIPVYFCGSGLCHTYHEVKMIVDYHLHSEVRAHVPDCLYMAMMMLAETLLHRELQWGYSSMSSCMLQWGTDLKMAMSSCPKLNERRL